MNLLDLTFPTPAENLACDEALLDWREANGGEGILRFWESPEPFVVVGYANKIEAEVDVVRCAAKEVPIFRRCSGGGTVLQGPGCLNYSLILQIGKNGSLESISGANKYIMGRNQEAVQSVAEGRRIEIQGHTDLAFEGEISPKKTSRIDPMDTMTCAPLSPSPPWGRGIKGEGEPSNQGASIRQDERRASCPPQRAGSPFHPCLWRKFSGNSQRRHKNFLLFHGTFLLNFDFAAMEEFLKFPSRQPDYRNGRGHADFLANLNSPAAAVKAAMKEIWQAERLLQNPPLEGISKLAREKYATAEWNMKFP